ncbi:hypothetical protein CDAR_404641 [Caerostris darwini]|uniref:Uncharacterized protein n=1 Tax=Caerostris darwini TaxID=1538125 RepID=A0AAV4SYB9_9ARAC|nr:hypothetical protein CDAR_404641 [Caerostris darwini]
MAMPAYKYLGNGKSAFENKKGLKVLLVESKASRLPDHRILKKKRNSIFCNRAGWDTPQAQEYISHYLELITDQLDWRKMFIMFRGIFSFLFREYKAYCAESSWLESK